MNGYLIVFSIQSPWATRCAAETINFISLIIKVVVIGKFLATFDWSVRWYNDMLLLLYGDYFCRTISVTRVIQIASLISMECRIDDILFVKTEKIAVTNTFLFVDNLTFIRNFVTNLLTYVFYHNFICSKIFVGKEPVPVNLAWPNLNTLRLCLT